MAMDMHAEIATIDKQYTSPAACIKAYGLSDSIREILVVKKC
jgi:hypothetical protein